MKKIINVLLICGLCFSFFSCGEPKKENQTEKLKKELNKAIDDASGVLEKEKKAIKKEVKQAEKEIENAVEKASDKMNEAIDDAKSTLDKLQEK